MSYYDQVFYCNAGDQSTTGYYSVAKRPQNAAVAAGQLVRQFTAPAVGSERVFACVIAGTTANTTDATWVLTRGAKTVDGTATWMECTGIAAVNGDKTNTVNWTQAKAIGVPTLGTVIQRNNGASFQICTTAGTLGAAEPSFSDTAGVTTTETSATTVWTSLGPVGNFTGGQAPHARINNALAVTWWVAGNTIYVGDNHAESQATAITIQPAVSASTIGKIICHNHSGSYPPASGNLTTGATVSTTAAVTLTVTIGAGMFYFYGVAFKAGAGLSSGFSAINFGCAGAWIYFDRCSLQIANTLNNASNAIQFGTTTTGNAIIVLNNTTVSFGAVLNSLLVSVPGCQFIWQNTGTVLVSGSAVPTILVVIAASGFFAPSILLEALDLSQITSTIFSSGGLSAGGSSILIKDCALNAAAIAMTTPAFVGPIEQLVRSDSGATAYKSARYAYEGTETTETSITRVGGASDPTGQQQSRKVVTTANSQWLRPFKAEPYAQWNPRTGTNVTVTVCGTINAGALPNNDDIWLEVEYLGSSASPLGTIVTTTKANVLAAGAAVASDGSTWNGGGSGAGWLPFKLVAVLSSPQPGMAGYLHARVRVAKPSTTYYLDPQVVLS